MEEKKILLGIDPSFVNMGACVYDPRSKEMKLKSGEFDVVNKWIGLNCKLDEVVAIVENPALDSPGFKMWGIMWDSIQKMISGRGGMSEVQKQFGICMNYGMKVGENKAAAKLIIKLLKDRGVDVLEVAPSGRRKAKKKIKGRVVRLNVLGLKYPTKTDKNQFYELTGYNGNSSEHSRDAATLVWGMSIVGTNHLIRMQELKRGNGNGKKPKTLPGSHNNNYSLFKK
jgi:hypothetical protein